MDQRVQGARRVVLDQAILATCTPEDDTGTLRRKLREAGALRGEPSAAPDSDISLGTGPLGAYERLQLGMQQLERAEQLAKTQGPQLHIQPMHIAAALGAGLMVGLAGLHALLALSVSALLLFLAWATPRQPRPAAPGDPVRRARQGAQAALRDLVGRDYIVAGSGWILESTPSLGWLARRREDLARAQERAQSRLETVVALKLSLVRTNTQLGRPPEDEEVQAMEKELARVRQDQEALAALDQQLEQQQRLMQEQVERLRLLATRQALSAQVGTLLDAEPGHRRLAAEVELDISALQAQLSALKVELSDADAALRAVMETEAHVRATK